jgi:hypothetical protein
MKNGNKKIVLILAVISILICGCPGCSLLVPGIESILDAMGNYQGIGDLLLNLLQGFLLGGWKICLGGVLLLVPTILVVIVVINHAKKGELEDLVPTGVSKDDPIPPPS